MELTLNVVGLRELTCGPFMLKLIQYSIITPIIEFYAKRKGKDGPKGTKGADIYVVRVMKNTNNIDVHVFGDSRPCEKCVKIMQSCKINRIFYSIRYIDNDQCENEIYYIKQKVNSITKTYVSSGDKALKKVDKIGVHLIPYLVA